VNTRRRYRQRLVSSLFLASVAAMAIVVGMPAPSQAAGSLHIYNWGEYTPPELIEKFSTLYDVEVTVDEYDSNETMLAKVRAGGSGYDIVVPGDYAVEIMIGEGLLARTEPHGMDNFANVEPDFVDVYWDRGRNYTVPWTYGLTSFAVDTSSYAGPTDTIGLLFDPPAELSGRIAMLDDMVSTIHAAERYVGVPRCTADRDQLRQVMEVLMAAKPHWRAFGSDSINKLTGGDADLAQTWSGSAVVARRQVPEIAFAFTREPMEAFADNVAVLADAPNLDNARLFQNFVMDPVNAAMVSEFAGYSNSVAGSRDYFSPELRDAPELNPPDWVSKEFVPPCPAEVTALYSAMWTALRR
jgi:spermidine/putrescine transport system substrate-binding protein